MAGDYAALYSGKIELGYNKVRYINHPYWHTDKFYKGIIGYNGCIYSNILLRYDTYKGVLVTISPQKRYILQVDMRKVSFFIINEQKFIPQGDGFVALLYKGENLCLTQHVTSVMGTPIRKGKSYYNQFYTPIRFSLYKEGTVYEVNSYSDLLRVFPMHKKQLKSYCQKENLSFKKNNEMQSMIQLVKYADSLIY